MYMLICFKTLVTHVDDETMRFVSKDNVSFTSTHFNFANIKS